MKCQMSNVKVLYAYNLNQQGILSTVLLERFKFPLDIIKEGIISSNDLFRHKASNPTPCVTLSRSILTVCAD